ncbi:MAG: cytochrome c [Bacteroidota bacterium]
MKTAASIFVFIIAAGMAILYFVNAVSQETSTQRTILGCGVVYSESYLLLSEAQKKGERLFKINCASCHKLDQFSAGPALRGIQNRYLHKGKNLDSFFKINRDFKKPRVIKYFISPEITDEDLQNILMYTDSPKI